MSMSMTNVSIIIPSLNPDEKLMCVVNGLLNKGFKDIILVNDGSDEHHQEPFEQAKALGCTVLVHEVNKGKGRALKTAFEYCLDNRKDITGVVTVDGDNQHQPDDIYNCAMKMNELKDNIILGVRDFSGPEVPKKSKFGNNLTSWVFKFVCGLNISDTQTGLRAIPYSLLGLMLEISGERFEYETNMLLEMKRNKISFQEVSIKTVYIEENASTHFHPIRDSFKIYAVIFKFLFSSLTASVIDIGAFSLISLLLYAHFDKAKSILIATVVARVISSLFNFTANHKAVFKSKRSMKSTVVRYYILCVAQMMMSYGLVYMVTDLLKLGGIMTIVAKLIIDVILFAFSFKIQQTWVF